MGLLKFNEGKIQIDDNENVKLNEYNIIDTVAYIPQEHISRRYNKK